MNDPAGRLQIHLHRQPEGLAVTIHSSRLTGASRVFIGKDLTTTVRTLPSLFSVCATAQAVACVTAGEAALGIRPHPRALAARLLPAGYSAIFNATAPLMGVLIGALFFHEAATARKLIGVTVGLAGVTLLTAVGPVAMGWPELLGALACLVATSCYGISGFLTQRWIHERGGLNPKLVATGSQFGATLLLLPFFAASATLAPPPSWGNPSLWLALAALGLLCTAWAYILFFRLMENIGPVRSLTVTFLVPAFGVLWGVLFLGEQVSWAHLAGGGMIGLALWLVVSHPGQKTARP